MKKYKRIFTIVIDSLGIGAMANAAESIKAIARYQTDDNNHQGALNVIQAVLDNTSPFNV